MYDDSFGFLSLQQYKSTKLMLTKKEEALFFSFRQHLFYATEAKTSLIRFGYITKGIN